MPAAETQPAPVRRPSVAELFEASVVLGIVGFGGGISVLGIIESLAVIRRRWFTPKEFATTATVAQMLPGGAAANALAVLGLKAHGFRGAVAGYVGFALPGALMITALAWVYVRFGAVPKADALLSGMNASVVGVILAIAVRMVRTSIARPWQMGVAFAALVLSTVGGAGSGEVALLSIAVGLGGRVAASRVLLLRRRRARRVPSPRAALPEEGAPLTPAADATDEEPPPVRKPNGLPVLLVLVAAPALAQFAAELASIAVVFFRTGLGAYGGGFAIIPALKSQVVQSHHWLTERQFADAVAVGKLTPGPVLLMATFIGYLKAGVAGALVSTIAILAAPFLLVVLLASWLDSVRTNRWTRAALQGLTPGVVGLMVGAAITLGSSMKTGIGVAIAASVALTLIRFEKANPVALIALGGVVRLALKMATGL